MFILVVTCSTLAVPSNAAIKTWQPAVGSLSYNSNVTFQCNTGFWFSRGVYVQFVVCANSGNWTSISQCVGKLFTVMVIRMFGKF